jgi:Holliday junction resolvase RusA-like endonuclease
MSNPRNIPAGWVKQPDGSYSPPTKKGSPPSLRRYWPAGAPADDLIRVPIHPSLMTPNEICDLFQCYTITIVGQIRGGKNNMVVTRKGKRFPKKAWAKWRDNAVRQVQSQRHFDTITHPAEVKLEYWAGDRRRRDMPAILDSIFHVLEKAKVVADDTLLWVTESSRAYSKDNPRAVITIKVVFSPPELQP